MRAMATLFLSVGVGTISAYGAGLDVDAVAPPLPTETHGNATTLIENARTTAMAKFGNEYRTSGSSQATANRTQIPTQPAAPRSRDKRLLQFLKANWNLKFSDVAAVSKVANEAEFEQMKKYYRNVYNGIRVNGRIAIAGREFLCVPVQQQLAMRRRPGVIDTPPSPDPAPGPAEASILGYPDKNCPTGNVPMPQDSLRDIAQSPTLSDFLSMGIVHAVRMPGALAPEAPGADSGDPHRYAMVYQKAEAIGVSGALSVWNPQTPANQASNSQVWLVGTDGGVNVKQTIEAGWHVYPPLYANASSPFVFSTQDGYADKNKFGCYDVACDQFVQVTAQPVFAPFAPERLSLVGGPQRMLRVVWYRKPSTGNWWVKMNGTWVGYYPADLFRGGPLSRSADLIEFGGETAAVKPEPQMGSGAHASAGYGHAAFSADLAYWDATGARQNVNANVLVDAAKCYSVAYQTGTAPSSGTYFYFGGPGRADPKCREQFPLE